MQSPWGEVSPSLQPLRGFRYPLCGERRVRKEQPPPAPQRPVHRNATRNKTTHPHFAESRPQQNHASAFCGKPAQRKPRFRTLRKVRPTKSRASAWCGKSAQRKTTLPHFAESCPQQKHVSALCGKPAQRKPCFRTLRNAARDKTTLPRFVESRLWQKRASYTCRKPARRKSSLPTFVEKLPKTKTDFPHL